MLDNQTGNLLIVEDDEALRLRLSRAMERRGFGVRGAASVAQALAEIAADQPDFAIVDLKLLDGSGLDIIGELKRDHPEVRTLVLTGYGDIPTAVWAAHMGATDYMAKPVTADEITDVLMTPKGAQTPPPDHPIPPEEARMAHIETVYQNSGENVSKAARLLNMHRRTLQRILQRHKQSDRDA
ncbi:MAG: response regulator [Pseudomonadota bacterium]